MDTPYRPLDPTHREIRLLELAPGSYNDDLVITLRVESLDREWPEYHALSYVWGQEISQHDALVNGRSMPVGLNLDCALRHLRCGISEPKLIWADALCINQQDAEERTSQVLMMKEIYSSAQYVLVWLGSENPQDDYALAYIQSGTMPETGEEAVLLLNILGPICRRPWFGRVWVVQELALSRGDPLMYFGTRTLLWSQFFDYMDRFVKAKETEVPALFTDRTLHYNFMQVAMRVTKLGRIRVWASQASTLTIQAFRTASCLVTDPRDKVFGLLGITSRAPSQIALVPDYSKTIQRVFSEATFSMLQEKISFPYSMLPLHPPRITTITSNYQALPDLPSWALDLNISSQTSEELGKNDPYRVIPDHTFDMDQLLRGACHIPNRIRVSDEYKRLYTQGVHLGTIIEASGSALALELINYRKRAAALHSIYNNHLKPRSIPKSVFLQALTIGGQLFIQNPRPFEKFLDGPMDAKNLSLYYKAIIQLMSQDEFVLFITEKNQVGVAYHCDLENGIRHGDVVVGLFGINCPFVLRPVPGGLDGRPAHTMINIAHVANHKWGHEFLVNAGRTAEWRDFRRYGLEEYMII
jgi:hypothetical protein